MSLFDIEKISQNLLKRSEIVWFYDLSEEKRSLSDEVKNRICELAASWDNYDHPEFEHRYDDFVNNKNRNNYEDPYINKRACLADMAFYEFFIGGGKYLNNIENLILEICSEKTWCVPSHYKTKTNETSNHVIELYSAETASVLSLVISILGDKLPHNVNATVTTSVEERMFIPYTETDKYGWMGADGRSVNNWNPWINSNVIFCAALICEDEEKYRSLVLRALSFTENYITSLSDDCLCDEGVRYWALSGACLFDIAEILYDITAGRVDITKSEQVRMACDYITGMYDEYGNPANFADATIDFYPQCPILIRAGERTGNTLLAAIGKSLYRPSKLRVYHDNFYRQFKDFYTASHIKDAEKVHYPEAKLLKSINIYTMRKDGFFLAFKGNHNGESHNHNDVGNFVLYHKGRPIFIDAGVDFYSGFTFSKDRFNLWYMRSEYHNLPTINGKNQLEGKAYSATPLTIDGMRASTDISGAYGPDTLPWIRTAKLTNGIATITDNLSVIDGTVLNYMVKDEPKLEANKLIFPSGICAELIGAGSIKIEKIDITGLNPPDEIIADALNRTDNRSYLIPRIMTYQWCKNEIFKITARPEAKEVILKVYQTNS